MIPFYGELNMSDFDYLLSKIKELEYAVDELQSTPTYQFALREDLKEDKRFLPAKAEPEASGYDVRAAQEDRKPIIVKPGQYIKIPLGFKSFCKKGWYYQLHPRSSSFVKKNIHNLIGIIDETWEGQTLFAGQYLPDASSAQDDLIINFGDPIGQIIPVKRQEMMVEEISEDRFNDLCDKRQGIRKSGGFGSTDPK